MSRISAKPFSALIVDDSEFNREVLKRNVESLNGVVVTASDGKEALDILAVESFDLVLLDIMMPEMDGYKVLQTINTTATLKSLPVIMVSAVDDMESVISCIRIGAVDYIIKPFDSYLLKNRILRVIERVQQSGFEVAAQPSNRVMRILVVDDSEINRDILKQRLVGYGYHVDAAMDGLDALEKLSQHNYDLILLDIMMPGLDGYATLERVKSNDNLKSIPVVMISALHDREVSSRCMTLGAADFITKPFNSVLLRARLQSFLASAYTF